MVTETDHGEMNGTSFSQFTRRHGFMPPTVVQHEEKSDGMTLITASVDPEQNIEIYNDDRAPHRAGETPEWAKGE